MPTIFLDSGLTPADVAAVARGAGLRLSDAAHARLDAAAALVAVLVDRGIRAYGVNTGVGALCDVVVDRDQQSRLSHNILMSHATGIGAPLGRAETRAIMATAVSNFALGHSGVRRAIVDHLVALLNADILPEVPSRGSVGYLSHMAHIALLLVGSGRARLDGRTVGGREALAAIGLEPLVLGAKEGLSLVNGTPCATGLACLALDRGRALLDWADGIAAMTLETLKATPAAFAEPSLALRLSPGLQATGARLRALLADSALIAAGAGQRTQDALSLRAVPHVHGAARDQLDAAETVIARELASVTDNPLVRGTPEAPEVHSEAHAVGAALALALDGVAVALAEVGAMAERRLDRMLNHMVNGGLPAFLAAGSGVASGFMIAQYAALSLVNENRRLALPASLDGGITSALQEDHLPHATPAALKALAIVENSQRLLAIEWLAAVQAYDLQPAGLAHPAPGLQGLYGQLRAGIAFYADDRPLADDMETAFRLIADGAPSLPA